MVEFSKAAGFAAAGGILTFLGLMHGEEVGAFENPTVVVAYFAIATVLYACSNVRRGRPGAGDRGTRHERRRARAGAGVGGLTTGAPPPGRFRV